METWCKRMSLNQAFHLVMDGSRKSDRDRLFSLFFCWLQLRFNQRFLLTSIEWVLRVKWLSVVWLHSFTLFISLHIVVFLLYTLVFFFLEVYWTQNAWSERFWIRIYSFHLVFQPSLMCYMRYDSIALLFQIITERHIPQTLWHRTYIFESIALAYSHSPRSNQ